MIRFVRAAIRQLFQEKKARAVQRVVRNLRMRQ